MNKQRGPRYKQVPLWRDANIFLVEIEQTVRQFSRYHKYTLGTELRQQAMNICRLVARSAQCTDPVQRVELIKQLVWQIEDIKMSVQLAKELQAFKGFAQFQRLAEQAVVLGKQSGGWWKRARSVAQVPSTGV